MDLVPFTHALGRRRCRSRSASASSSRARSPPAPSCCCSTSRPPASTTRRSRRCKGQIRRVRDTQHVTVLLVEHHMSLVMSVSDKVVAIDFGKKIADGTPARSAARPRGDPRLSGNLVMAALLEVKGLKAYYGQTQALLRRGLRRSQQGGITTLLGANGAGKTTTLRAICNMVRTEGTIRFDGKDRSPAWRPRRSCGCGIAPRARGPRHLHHADASTRTCASPPTPAGTRRRSQRDRDMVFELFPAPQGAPPASRPARCRAASSRCWRSPAR